MVISDQYTKTQVQRKVGSKDRVKTNGQTDGKTDGQTVVTDSFIFPDNAVGNHRKSRDLVSS